ncbi:MAG: hypothetical protein AAGE65_03880 [Planctomycetota bacterium]
MRNTRLLRALGVGLLVIGLAGAASAAEVREAKAIMKDGRTLEGRLVIQNDRVVVLEIAGIETTLQRGEVAELEVQQTAQELYDSVRPTLADTDLSARLDLAREMADRDAFALARRELSDLARLFPGDPRIARLDTQVAAKEELAQQRVERDDRPAARNERRPRSRRDRNARPEASDLLSPDQINLIRVYEVDMSGEPRGITIKPETLERFFTIYRGADNQPLSRREQSRFRRQPGHEQLDAIFSTRDRSLYDGVVIASDPPALATFRNRVNGPYVVNYLMRHFGPDAAGTGPKLPLVGSRPSSVDEAYTNFYVLNAYVGPSGMPMIDRRAPEESLLLQWGLPRERAIHPAPQGVEGWEPAFRSVDDPRFQLIVAWINSLFPNPPANYGFSFTPGGVAPPPAPAPQADEADDSPAP